MGPKLTLDQTTVDSGTKGRKVRLNFDQLGTAAPMTVKAKIKLRGLGVKGLSYKDTVATDDNIWWYLYFGEIEKLKGLNLLAAYFY